MPAENIGKDYTSHIKEDHVKATLKSHKGEKAELISWITKDFTAKGDNYSTIVTSVNVSYQLEGKSEEISYVVKINPNLGFDSGKAFVQALFKKEGGFYEHIAPLLNKVLTDSGLLPLRIPKLYYSFLEESNELIFMEDLRCKGFKMFDRKKGLDVPHAVLVFEELARMHAASVLLKAKRPFEDLIEEFSFLDYDWHKYPGFKEDMIELVFTNSYNTALEMLKKIGGYEKGEIWLTKSKSSIRESFEKYLVREEPFTMICHGDCWNNNVLFRYDENEAPVEVMLVDLQINRVASPSTDINYLMFTSVNGDVRSANENLFLTSYYDSFEKVMAAAGTTVPFTFQQHCEEYRKMHEFGLIFGLLTIGVVVMPSEDIPDMDVDVKEEDIPRLMAEWNEKVVSSAMSNPLFKPRFLSLFDMMIKRGVIA